MKRRWKMRKDIAISKNLDLLNEFMKYAFENPDVLEKIPPGAELIILPLDDPELYEYNKGMADRLVSQGEEVVCVKMKIPKIPAPKLELYTATKIIPHKFTAKR
jgi:hypothetical protein